MPDCNCSRPPGGGGRCPGGFIAICRVENGECRVRCVDPSRVLTVERRALRAAHGSKERRRRADTRVSSFVLGAIRGSKRNLDRVTFQDADDLMAIMEGDFVKARGGKVQVALPQAVATHVRGLLRDKGMG